MNNNRKTILDIPVDTYLTDEFVSKIKKRLYSSGINTIFAVNAEKIMGARKDPELLLTLKEADFLIPDGIGTVIGLRFIHQKRVPRTAGIMLMDRLLDLAAKEEFKVFIFGSRPEVNRLATENILEAYSSLKIVGAQHGHISNEEYGLLVDRINSSKADILFVGLGSPKQEKWIHNYQKSLKVKICMGIGGSLDIIAGRASRAPLTFQTLGLEWLYRLIKEPARFKRQLVLPKFAWEVLKEILRLPWKEKKFSLSLELGPIL